MEKEAECVSWQKREVSKCLLCVLQGYSTGLCVTPSEGTAELRGRIRNLLCRTRETSRQDAANPHLKPFTNHRKAGVVAE